MDVVARTADVPRYDVRHHVVEFGADKCAIVRRCEIGAHRLEEPERAVYVVVFGSLAAVGKAVGQHPLVGGLGKRPQNTLRDVETTRRQGESRQRDHRVATPIAEPVVPGNNRAVVSSRDDVLIRGGG